MECDIRAIHLCQRNDRTDVSYRTRPGRHGFDLRFPELGLCALLHERRPLGEMDQIMTANRCDATRPTPERYPEAKVS